MLNGHTLAGRWWTDTGVLRLLLVTFGSRVRGTFGVFSIGLLLQVTAFFSRSRAGETNRARMATDTVSGDLLALVGSTAVVTSGGGVVGTGRSGRQVRNVLGDGVLRANVGDANI